LALAVTVPTHTATGDDPNGTANATAVALTVTLPTHTATGGATAAVSELGLTANVPEAVATGAANVDADVLALTVTVPTHTAFGTVILPPAGGSATSGAGGGGGGGGVAWNKRRGPVRDDADAESVSAVASCAPCRVRLSVLPARAKVTPSDDEVRELFEILALL
jgi:hypothetical protein